MADTGHVFLPPDIARPTPQDVVRAYLLIFGRLPESESTIALHCQSPDLATLGERLVRSAEFRVRYGHELAPAPRGSCAICWRAAATGRSPGRALRRKRVLRPARRNGVVPV